jgi:acyl carrier protein
VNLFKEATRKTSIIKIIEIIKKQRSKKMVFEKVKAIIVSEMNVEADKVTMDTLLVDDLGADSLDAVELIMALEEEFGMEMEDSAAQNVKSVGDLVKYIEAQIK